MRKILISSSILILLFSPLLGCGTGDETPGGSDNIEATLPSLGGGEDEGDCEVLGEMTIEEWIQSADGVVAGEIQDIQPALDLGYQNYGDGELKTSGECPGEIKYSFKVTLGELEGYLHDKEDLPDTLDVYFGSSHLDYFHWDMRPEVDEEGVEWPDDEYKMVEGMHIGGTIFENKDLERWSFIRSQQLPMFQVKGDDISFQGGMRDEPCGYLPPLEEIEDLGYSGLLSEISDLESEGGLFTEPEERGHDNGRHGGPFVGLCVPEDWDE